MDDKDKEMQDLYSRLEELARQQNVFQEEVLKIRQELDRLKNPGSIKQIVHAATQKPHAPSAVQPGPVNQPGPHRPSQSIIAQKTPWEEFIGANLLNKVGIAVLVLGIGIGVKYSIDHNLVSEATRIVLGYLSGAVLLGIAFRLRASHMGFSAVLLSGAMAVFYFVTYVSYAFYDGLIPQIPAFLLMVMFTAFTVIAAVRYNMEVIGIIGLTGAYAVPLLLSDGAGRVEVLFSYMAIINTGILVLAFKKYWKSLYYTAFILTWFTYAAWYAFSFETEEHFSLSLVFSTIFFLIFYCTFLSYKLVRQEPLARWDIVCMLVNSFLYFGYGYLTVESARDGEEYLGAFAVFTALMHFTACLVIYKMQARFSDSFYFVAGMVLIFVTLAVPIQLEGNWVTLIWAAEAALLFWIGRTKVFPAYEKLSYPLTMLAFVSLLHDWTTVYPPSSDYLYLTGDSFRPFLNINFLTSVLVGGAFAYMLFISGKFPREQRAGRQSAFNDLVSIGFPLLTVFVAYVAIFKEIEALWNFLYATSRVTVRNADGVEFHRLNEDLLNFKRICLIIYSAAFAWLLFFLQLKWPSNRAVIGSLAFTTIVLFVFITAGLLNLAELRASFLEIDVAQHFAAGPGHIIIRYVAMTAVVPLMWLARKLARHEVFSLNVRRTEEIYLHFIVLVLLSSELISWLEIARVENSFKLSLSILWGGYALFLIIFGLSRDLKHIRLTGMVLFAVTLLKLFIYDMEDMSTLLKTVVMIILGVLLLTASFIYTKYKRPARNQAP